MKRFDLQSYLSGGHDLNEHKIPEYFQHVYNGAFMYEVLYFAEYNNDRLWITQGKILTFLSINKYSNPGCLSSNLVMEPIPSLMQELSGLICLVVSVVTFSSYILTSRCCGI
eukprot:scaffold2632_cov158-Amphora_coffeaeformis.AAC.4